MTNFRYKKIIYLYIISFILMLVAGMYLKKSIRNKLVIFDDKDQVIKYLSNSMSIKVNEDKILIDDGIINLKRIRNNREIQQNVE